MKQILFCSIITLMANISFAQKSKTNIISEKIVSNNPKPTYSFYTYNEAVKKNRYKMAIITPMYLDSFDLAKNLVPLPKFASPGIEFYIGTLIALDTIEKMKIPVDVHIYDSKSRFMNMQNLVESDKLDSMDVIIGNVSAADLKTLADFAKAKNINYVSAVSPADGGQSNNPYFTLLQPRLITHTQRIYNTINENNSTENIVFINRDVSNEINANNYFKNIQAANGANNKIIPKLMQINGNSINVDALKKQLDDTKENTIILAILDPQVAYENLQIIHNLISKGYKIKVFGMPSWDNIKSLKDAKEFPDMDIYFTSAQLVDKSSSMANNYVFTQFKKRMGTNPTDMAFKACNAVYFYANILNRYGSPFNEKMQDNISSSFTAPLNLKPSFEKDAFQFFENKFLYLVKHRGGIQTYE